MILKTCTHTGARVAHPWTRLSNFLARQKDICQVHRRLLTMQLLFQVVIYKFKNIFVTKLGFGGGVSSTLGYDCVGYYTSLTCKVPCTRLDQFQPHTQCSQNRLQIHHHPTMISYIAQDELGLPTYQPYQENQDPVKKRLYLQRRLQNSNTSFRSNQTKNVKQSLEREQS